MTRTALTAFSKLVGPSALVCLLAFAPGCDIDVDDDDEGAVEDDDDDDDDVDNDDDGSGDSGSDADAADALPLADALTIAQDQFPGATIIEASLSNGPPTAYWDVELFGDGIEYEVYVSAEDGSVLEVDEDTPGPADAAASMANATLVQSSPGWGSLIVAAESAVDGLAFALDADDGLLEVHVRGAQTWAVEFDAGGEIVDMDPT